ncbi:MAG TPA: DinB family protein [Verrucomicrobiae bacterium]|nr:DinB family protein [Verrucomicrobiae bacterium]
MNVYGGKELARQFRTVRTNTIQIAQDIPEEQYNHIPAPECRSVGQMLTHIAVAPQMWQEIHGNQRLMTLVGFDFLALAERVKNEESKSRNKAEILELLRSRGESFAAWLETLTPEVLSEMVTVADGSGTKSRFEQLLGAKEHEMHHRAQLMLIERQLGIVPHLTKQFNDQLAKMRAARTAS